MGCAPYSPLSCWHCCCCRLPPTPSRAVPCRSSSIPTSAPTSTMPTRWRRCIASSRTRSCSGSPRFRAMPCSARRLAAKLLHVAGGKWSKVPVYAGISTPTQYMKQVEWAQGFAARQPARVGRRGVHAPRDQRTARQDHDDRRWRAHEYRGTAGVRAGHRQEDPRDLADGRICLSRLCAGLEARAGVEHQVQCQAAKRGVRVRGAAAGGAARFDRGSQADAGDARADLHDGTPLNDALASLDQIWRYTNHWKGNDPTLFDVLAVELVAPRHGYELTSLRIDVNADGLTSPVAGEAGKTQVALKVDPAAFLAAFVDRLR